MKLKLKLKLCWCFTFMIISNLHVLYCQNLKNHIKEISNYKVIINNGDGFCLHKDSVGSIMAKIQVDDNAKVAHININTAEVVTKISHKYEKYGSLVNACEEDNGVNYVVGNNNLFNMPYYNYDDKSIKNEPIIFDKNLLVFLQGCREYNLFIWEINGDLLCLKTVMPDIISSPSKQIYRTSLGVKDKISYDSRNYFFVVLKYINWADPADEEHVDCDVDNDLYVCHYNTGKNTFNHVFKIEMEKGDYYEGMSLEGSNLIISCSHQEYSQVFTDNEGNIIEVSPDDYPYENPGLIQEKEGFDVYNYTDTVNVGTYVK